MRYRLSKRLGKLEDALDAPFMDQIIQGELRRNVPVQQARATARHLLLVCRQAEREAPPIPAPDGKEDIGPTVLRLAELLGLDPEVAYEEALRIIAETE